MRRGVPEERIDALLEAAIKIFMRYGYRRAQMADIAAAMGVAPGTIYRYVEGKEALFDLALQRACGEHLEIDLGQLPVVSSTPEQILARVDALFRGSGLLEAIHQQGNILGWEQVREEFTLIIARLYEAIFLKHRGIAIVEASAIEWPELSDLFYGLRHHLVAELTAYLALRMGQGALRQAPHPAASARLILETISWFAYHRFSDPKPDGLSEPDAREAVIDTLVHAFTPAEPLR